jgi:AraC-like DNA-binding protein
MGITSSSPQFLKQYNDIVVFGGKDVVTKMHSHHAIEILLSFNSHVSLETGDGFTEGRGIVLQRNVVHANKGNGFVLFIFIDPESQLGRRLGHWLTDNLVLIIKDTVVDQIKQFVNDLLTNEFSESEISAYITRALVEDAVLTERNYTVDTRIDKVINHIKSNLHKPLELQLLKDIACLSESRLMHLFKKELGIPIRKYVLWCRLQMAIRFYLKGHTLTQSAHLSGFADIAHFIRTFVSMFGMTPSHILKNFS